MDANVVIGLQFGDEGKGRTVSWLIEQNQLSKLVVRFSGGQQAGHTVIHNGIKHIFSNFGSGELQNCPTYISEHCTIYPNTLEVESNVLYEKTNRHHQIIAHPMAMITTPYDVLSNRINESKHRHGSVGLGVGATMKRNFETPYKLRVIDTLHSGLFKQKVEKIKKYYEKIHGKLNFDTHIKLHSFNTDYENEIERFYELFDKNIMIDNYSRLLDYESLIFEGSQGILLDMDHGIFPNVTYGNTTSRNAIEIIKKLGIDNVNMYYITRCYQTRHGNGWMSNEDENFKLINNENEINVNNQWQGNFRCGEIDANLINYAYLVDKIYSSEINTVDNLVMTCFDQLDKDKIPVKKLNDIKNHISFNKIYAFDSPITESQYKTF